MDCGCSTDLQKDCRVRHNPITTQRKYTVLRDAYMRFNQYWGTPVALLQNLDSLETA